MVVERFAVLGWNDTACRADEQWLADLLLQAGHLLAERRLNDEQLAGRLRQAAALDDLDKVPELLDVHVGAACSEEGVSHPIAPLTSPERLSVHDKQRALR